MWALIKDGNIEKLIGFPKGITVNNIQYSKDIFKVWSNSERAAIGIYPVTAGTTKDEDYYTNGDPSYSWDADNSVVIESISNTARTLSTVKTEQTLVLNNHASEIIKPYVWLAERKVFADTAIPDAVTTYLAAVRSAAATATTNVGNASDVDAVATAVKNASWPDDSDMSNYKRYIRY